jgi:cell division protein FtsB
MVALISLGVAKYSAKERLNDLQQQAQTLVQENEQLENDISLLGTIESVKKLAQEFLNLVVPGTVFFSTGE